MGKTSSNTNGRREPPPLMLAALVSEFLAKNGFKSSHRILNNERQKRPAKEGWRDSLGAGYSKGFPPLETIFKQWKTKCKVAAQEETESDETDTATDNSSEESSEASDSDMEMQDIEENTNVKAAGSNTSDSEADTESSSEEEAPISQTISKSTTPVNALKRKAQTSSDESSQSSGSEDSASSAHTDSSDESEEEEQQPPQKKLKLQATESASSDEENNESESESESESGSESGSESSSGSELEVAINTQLPDSSSDVTSSEDESSIESSSDDEETTGPKVATLEKAPSDSSGTITGETKIEPTVVEVKKRHIGAHPTRLAQISAAADPDAYLSNQYVSYEYADKAYRDLSVTRGKGFTKEKNKKKRGSYRGGPIDTSGGKSFKFED